ncbi:MAG: IS4 family transposase [Umezawaea sp.]
MIVVPVVHSWIGLSDEVRLGVLTRWVTPGVVDETLAACGRLGRRPGALSARFMVYFTLALALFHSDSYDDVAENLVGALPDMGENIPNRASFTRARQRLGARPLEAVFRAVAGPVAPDGLAGAFYRGMRLAAVDGFLLDVPDTEANRRTFGGPSDARGNAAGFPQVRVVTLTETGTHASIDARVGGFNGGERELAIAMAGSATGMLVIMDRGFPGVELWKAYTAAGAYLLLRARSSVARRPVRVLSDGTYLARMNLAGQKGAHPGGVLVRVVEYTVDGGEIIRLLTDLLDPDAHPAVELAALYHERWEAESSYRQIKTFQRGPQQVLRSAGPDLARQEVWAHLTVHHCLTRIIMDLADGQGIDPDRLSFTKVLKHVRRSVVRQCADTPAKIRAFLAMLASKVRRKLDNGGRRLREAVRLLKRPESKYSYRGKVQQRGPTGKVSPRTIVLNLALVE